MGEGEGLVCLEDFKCVCVVGEFRLADSVCIFVIKKLIANRYHKIDTTEQNDLLPPLPSQEMYQLRAMATILAPVAQKSHPHSSLA
jgi:hypothetical protein